MPDHYSPMLNEILDCDTCGVEIEVFQLEPHVILVEAPMCAEDWGE
jgi:lysine biosynthesis protein LysW